MHNKGFTIIETLVAITILMISITGPMVVANNALGMAVDGRNQMIAINLAQETMELIRNAKDNARINMVNWANLCNAFEGDICQTDYRYFEALVTTTCDTAFDDCDIKLDANRGYNNESQGSATPFYRYFYVEKMGTDYLVTVEVTWKTGSLDNIVKIEELMNTEPRL